MSSIIRCSRIFVRFKMTCVRRILMKRLWRALMAVCYFGSGLAENIPTKSNRILNRGNSTAWRVICQQFNILQHNVSFYCMQARATYGRFCEILKDTSGSGTRVKRKACSFGRGYGHPGLSSYGRTLFRVAAS